MKKVIEMSEKELSQTLEVMEAIDSPEAKKLAEEIKAEQARREVEREAKRKAEEERKRQEEQAIVEKNKKNEKELRRKQHNVLGKYFKLSDGEVYYKVVGVIGNQAFLECACKYQVGTYSSSYTTHFTRSIDSLLENGVEVTEEEYLAQAGKSINLSMNAKDLYRDTMNLYNDVLKDFNKVWRAWF